MEHHDGHLRLTKTTAWFISAFGVAIVSWAIELRVQVARLEIKLDRVTDIERRINDLETKVDNYRQALTTILERQTDLGHRMERLEK